MNPYAIFKTLKDVVEESPFAKSVGVEFGFDAMGFEPQHRYQVTVKPGDLANSVGPADSFAPTVDPRFVAVQNYFTTIRLDVDDTSNDEASQWQACASLRNWLHAELLRILPAGRMEIVSQSYDRVSSRSNTVAILLVLRTSEWIEANEDQSLKEILAKGEVDQTLLDCTDVFLVP